MLLLPLKVSSLQAKAAKIEQHGDDDNGDNPFQVLMDSMQELVNCNADACTTALKMCTQWKTENNQVESFAPSTYNDTEFELPSLDGMQSEKFCVPRANSQIGRVVREVLEAMRMNRDPQNILPVSKLKQMEKASRKMQSSENRQTAMELEGDGDEVVQAGQVLTKATEEREDSVEPATDGQDHSMTTDEHIGTMAAELQDNSITTSGRLKPISTRHGNSSDKIAVEHEGDQPEVVRSAQPDGSCILFRQENDADYLHEIVSRRSLDGRMTDDYLDRVFWGLTNVISKDQYTVMTNNFIVKMKRAKRLEMETQLRPIVDTGIRYRDHSKNHDNALFDQYLKGDMRCAKHKGYNIWQLNMVVEQSLEEAIEEVLLYLHMECDAKEAKSVADQINEAYAAGHQGKSESAEKKRRKVGRRQNIDDNGEDYNDDEHSLEADDDNVGGTKVEGKHYRSNVAIRLT